MNLVITKNVTPYFLSIDPITDIENFHNIAREALLEFGYIGISVPNTDYTKAEITFNTQDDEAQKIIALNNLLISYTDQSLAATKLEVFEKINNFRNAYMLDRFPYDGKRWNCDEESRINIFGMIMKALISGGELEPGEIFRDYDNNNVVVNASYMNDMGKALFVFRKSCYTASWIHKYYVGIMTDANAVKAYDFTVGWPNKDA